MNVAHPSRGLCGEEGESPEDPGRLNRETHQWRRRDTLAAALLFAGTAAFVLWQNARVAVLWDLGYLLDTSWRIALGQMPYRDFPLAHAPLTFLMQAGLIRLAGRHYFVQIAYAAFAGGLATILAWRVLFRIVCGPTFCRPGNWLTALLLATPLTVVGIYSVYPHPIYDCDCTLAILFAIWLFARLVPQTGCGPDGTTSLAAGAAAILPVFFKQNMGLPFLAAVAGGMAVLLTGELRRTRSLRAAIRSQAAFVLAGMAIALLIGAALIAATAGIGNYIHWTVQFAAQRRLPGLATMLSVYEQPSFAWALPTIAAGLIPCHTRFIARLWVRIAAVCLVAAPFAGSVIYLFMDDVADERADNLLALWPLLLVAALVVALFELRRGVTLGRMIPFFILAAIHGTLMSQQLWGSTYALWPLLMVLVAGLLATLPAPARPVAIGAAAAISAAFLICGGLYAASLERLGYMRIPEAPIAHSSLPALRGMATPGAYLSNFDELAEFAAREIPPNDAVLPLPGEDPFFYATGRTPRFPVTLFDSATDPYPASQMMVEARRRNVRWVIVKRDPQINENPMPEGAQAMDLVGKDFALYRRLRGYDVYRRQ
jgi:hypothetical protein